MAEDRMRFFRFARELNKEYKYFLKDKKLHFRGNCESFSLISLDRRTPEQGKGGFHDEKQGERFLLEKIDAHLTGNREKIATGKSRPTREKELQAWIIEYAVNHDNRLPFSNGLIFLTSELAFKKPEKTVNDILALDQDGSLVVIELKSSRDKATLQRQVEKFYKIIDDNKDFFEELVRLLAPGKAWNGQKRGLIVWPNSKFELDVNGQPRTDWQHGIVEVRYKEILDEKEQNQIYYDEEDKAVFL